MPGEVPPPTHVLTLVFLAWAVGTIAFGAWSRFWGVIQPGHFKVVWLVCTGLALAAGLGFRPAFVVAGLSLVTFIGIYRAFDREAGLVTALVGAAVLLSYSEGRAFDLGAAALLGAVTNAMLLGHWHLNQPRLGNKPILRHVWGLWAAIVVFAAVTALQVVDGLGAEAGVKTLGAVTAVAFTFFAAVLNAPVHHLVRTRSIMSATGILYLAILVCFVASFTGALAALAG